MSTAEDIRDDARINENHDDHVERGENHWFTCPLCDDEEDEPQDESQAPTGSAIPTSRWLEVTR